MSSLIQANALTIPLADESVQMCVTSPPYWGLRKYSGDMAYVWGGDADCEHSWQTEERYWDNRHASVLASGESDGLGSKKDARGKLPSTTCLHCGAWYGELGLEPTPELFVSNLVAVFREVHRVLHPTGVVFLNLGDSYNGSGGAGGDYNAGGLKDGQPKYPGRMTSTLKPKDLVGIPWRVAFALQADGWWLRSDIIWSKPNPMPESVTDRPTKAHEYVFLLTKNKKYYYDAEAIKEDSVDPVGSANRYEYDFTGRPGLIMPDGNKQQIAPEGKRDWKPGRNRRTVWTIATAPYSGAHFATFPPALVEPCIKVGTSERGCCPECGSPWARVVEKIRPEIQYRQRKDAIEDREGSPMDRGGTHNSGLADNAFHQSQTLGWQPICYCTVIIDDDEHPGHKVSVIPQPVPCTVFDPFAGSGTTLQVARALGRNGVGIDLSAEYLQLARERLSLDKLDAWGNGAVQVDGSIEDLPLFGDL